VFVSPGVQAERVLCGSQRFSVARAAATATVTLGPEDGLDLLLEWGGPHPPRPAARARRHPGPPERHRPQGTPLDRRRQPQRPLLQRAIRRAGHHQARRLLHEQPCRCRHHARPGCVRLRRPDRMHQTHDGPCSSRAAAFDGHTHAVLDGPAISKPAGSVASSHAMPGSGRIDDLRAEIHRADAVLSRPESAMWSRFLGGLAWHLQGDSAGRKASF
jgi:hypothetical protein